MKMNSGEGGRKRGRRGEKERMIKEKETEIDRQTERFHYATAICNKDV